MITKVEKELILEYLESQALASNVSEEVNKLITEFETLDPTYEQQDIDNIEMFLGKLKRVLQSPQSLEELKQEIIDDIKEWYKGYDCKFNGRVFILVKDEWDEKYTYELDMNFILKKKPNLAHKITTYIMRLENEK
jgi:uncharacterized protein (UPF0335 family)